MLTETIALVTSLFYQWWVSIHFQSVFQRKLQMFFLFSFSFSFLSRILKIGRDIVVFAVAAAVSPDTKGSAKFSILLKGHFICVNL